MYSFDYSLKRFALTAVASAVLMWPLVGQAAGDFINSPGISIGTHAGVQVKAKSKEAIAIGDGASAEQGSLAFGNGGIAIGTNASANAGGIHIGKRARAGLPSRQGATVVGDDSTGGGLLSTVLGRGNTIQNGGARHDVNLLGGLITQTIYPQATAAVAVGTQNTINANDNTKKWDGLSVAVMGAANQVEKSNGVLVMGTGNKVTGAYADLKDDEAKQAGTALLLTGDVKDFSNLKLGSVSVIGGGNTINNTTFSSVNGVHNNLTGSEHVYMAGSFNKVASAKQSLIMGNHQNIQGSGNMVFGYQDEKNTGTTATATTMNNMIVIGSGYKVKNDTAGNTIRQSVLLGDGATVSASQAVALGYGSEASRAQAEADDVYLGDKDDVKATVKGTYGAVSVGDANNTRQIVNVAAGAQDSDAVNVAQLKAVQKGVESNIAALDGRVVANENDIAAHKKEIDSHSAQITQLQGVDKGLRTDIDDLYSRLGTAPGTGTVQAQIQQLEQRLTATDQALRGQIAALQDEVHRNDRNLRAGVAGATALTFLQTPHPHQQKSIVSLAVGGYRNARAVAVGVSGRFSADHNATYKAGVSLNSARHVNWGGSVGFEW